MNSNNMIYGVRSNGLNHGDVFTSLEVIIVHVRHYGIYGPN